MQEIVLLLSSIAGVCTAAAVRKFPRNKNELVSIGANSQIKDQISYLKIEKEILTKTITRLYQHDAGLSKIKRDKLLIRYQHQLGVLLTKIDKLEEASKHPDLGPIGDGLISLMDQKLSQLDKRLYEISSKIAIANVQEPKIEQEPTKENEIEKKIQPELKQQPIIKKELEEETQKQIIATKPFVSFPKPTYPVEITTLTEISDRPLEFPIIESQKIETITNVVGEIVKPQEIQEDKMEIIQSSIGSATYTKPEVSEPLVPVKTSESLPQIKPEPTVKLPNDDKLDEDDDADLEKIKGEILKTLSKIEQAEVE